jgi:hypothetical protein
VVQSGFGDWLHDRRGMMELGWAYIVADLHAYLATGVKVSRFLRAWADFGADMSPYAGGLRVRNVAANGMAASLWIFNTGGDGLW